MQPSSAASRDGTTRPIASHLVEPEAGAPRLDPTRLAARWPAERPLLMLGSGRVHPRWSRWSILAEPRRWLVVHEQDAADPLEVVGAALAKTRRPLGENSPTELGALDQLAAHELPFLGGWIGFLGYELGRRLEAAVPRIESPGRTSAPRSPRRPDGHTWPVVCLAHCPRALIHDRAHDAWWSIGPRDESPLEHELRLVNSATTQATPTQENPAWQLDPLREAVPRERWTAAVTQAIELIRAGDIYQVNLAHQLRGTLHGAPRAFALQALHRVAPWHGALLELPDSSAILSLSPELFLAGELGTKERDGYVVSRPIKGTRPSSEDADTLLRSAKDEAELVMIVDLMRNDLGRVSRPGTVEVAEPRHIEEHPTVLQGVATVQGSLRREVDAAALLRATFPPGSVTGAPKVRAMQIIEELEPWARGPYCGAIGFFSDHGRFGWNVAIRTMAVAPPTSLATDAPRSVLYGVGCGIVVDSDPQAEWEESMDKAAVVRGIG